LTDLPRGFREQAYLLMDQKIDHWQMDLGQTCESPIEVVFGIALMISAWEYRGKTWIVPPQWDAAKLPYEADTELLLLPQREVLSYRVDFIVSRFPMVPGKAIAVECDGHDFHERTKAQAARDRQKDRDLQAAGYRILRFTGSEIYRDAFKCADEVLKADWQVNGGAL